MNITVLGAGNTGLAMAAHAVEQGNQVTLWNRFEEEISHLIDSHTIHTTGKVEGSFKLHLVTTNIEEALKDPDIIIIATPSFVHRYFAEEIAKYLTTDTFILLCPSRTYGALEFVETFKTFNHEMKPTVAETQTAIYTCRKTSDDTVEILSIKSNVLFSALDHTENEAIYDRVPAYIQTQLAPADSIIETSIGSVGMIMHCAPLLLNTGWTESKDHEYRYYNESVQITQYALQEYRKMRKNGEVEDMSKNTNVATRTEELIQSAKTIINGIEKHIDNAYTPEGFYKLFVAGFLPVPYLWTTEDEYKHAKHFNTRLMKGAIKVVDEEDRPVKSETVVDFAKSNLKEVDYLFNQKYRNKIELS